MSIVLDFTDVQGGNFEALPAGEYAAMIEKVEMKKAKTDGSDMIAVTWKITDEEYAGRKVFENYSLKPQALWKLKQMLTALGYKVEGQIEFDAEDLISQEATLVLEEDEYQGKPKNVVKEVK